jgi:5-methylcytosine-specific restriction endonuclease McrA
MTPTNQALIDAVDRYEEARARLEEAECTLSAARQNIGAVLIAEVDRAESGGDKLALARWAYWHTDAPAADVAASLGVSAPYFAQHYAGQMEYSFVCERCGGMYARVVTTRSKRDELEASLAGKNRKRFSSFVPRCADCWNTEQTRHSAEWEEKQRRQWQQIEALRTMPYSEYLRTDHWQDTRRRALRRADYRCHLCNSGGLLDVHHRTYENRGCEQSGDLIVLCRPCHAKFHDKVA